jgi:metallophosphoesterase (TIGR00282 family)
VSDSFNILFCGDVVGRSGRDALVQYLPQVFSKIPIEFTIINGENAAAGFGITPEICREFYKLGVDVITTGNHIWDQREIISYISSDHRLLRPANYPATSPGLGYSIYKSKNGISVCVMNLMTRLYMEQLDDPFFHAKALIDKFPMGNNPHAIFIDVHGEATSEKASMAHYLDGKVSAVVGTHTHVPTADHRILARGTAFMTDAGMCGDYDSVVGMDKDIAVGKFVNKMPSRLKPASGVGTLCGVMVTILKSTGLASKISPIRLGGTLAEIHPW